MWRGSFDRASLRICLDGCQAPVSISVDDPHECVNVYGYAFCLACMFGFYGSFDRSNRALTKAMSTRLRIRTRVPAAEREEQFRREKAYRKVVANNRFSPETMIGAPLSARRRKTTARMPA